MLTTINISLPKSMYDDARKVVAKNGYSSISELIRNSLRDILYPKPKLTENGFTKEFEDEILKSAAEPRENDIVLKNKKEMEDYFRHLTIPKRYRNKTKKKQKIAWLM